MLKLDQTLILSLYPSLLLSREGMGRVSRADEKGMKSLVLRTYCRAGEMTRLRLFTVLTDLTLVSSTHIRCSSPTVTPVSGDPSSLVLVVNLIASGIT